MRHHDIALSPRQAEGAMLVLRGHSSVSIGLRLGISQHKREDFPQAALEKVPHFFTGRAAYLDAAIAGKHIGTRKSRNNAQHVQCTFVKPHFLEARASKDNKDRVLASFGHGVSRERS